jgi:hypothetical protein
MLNEKALLLEPREEYDACIVGVCEKSGRAIYSVDKIIDVLVHNSMLDLAESPPAESVMMDDLVLEAEEFYYYNIAGAHMGELEPIYLRDRVFIQHDLERSNDSSDT